MDDQDGWLKDLSRIFNGEIWKDNGISLSGLSLFLWLYSSPKSRIKVMLLLWEWIRVAVTSRR